jgi:hypothetical protein
VGVCVVATVTLLWAGGWSWFLRDGLGPESVVSHGASAIAQFWNGFQLAAAVVGAEMVIAFAGYRWRTRQLLTPDEEHVGHKEPLP